MYATFGGLTVLKLLQSDTNTDYSKQIPKSTMKPSYSLHECKQSVDSNEHTKVSVF